MCLVRHDYFKDHQKIGKLTIISLLDITHGVLLVIIFKENMRVNAYVCVTKAQINAYKKSRVKRSQQYSCCPKIEAE